ncbi:DEAD/DEAH box helicase [Clostridium intestinale]|uniref:DEAD/DEAH box helicase n=1 Tax=Clostridium intestinale TaxID=36845 RepID=UPI0028E255D5|nr:DEAD/DEAH box helicase [Clostridium intestinale]
MSVGELIGILIDRTPTYSIKKATVVYNEGYIVNSAFESIDDGYLLRGEILSQDLISTYKSSITLNSVIWSVRDTSCTCKDFEKNSSKKSYRCKHINALLLSALFECDEEGNLEDPEENYERYLKEKSSTQEEFLLAFSEGIGRNIKEVVNLVPEFDIDSDYFTICFKIGREKLYVLKEIREFFNVFENQGEMNFGKEFTFDGKKHIFSEEYLRFLGFLITEVRSETSLMREQSSFRNSIIRGKHIILPISKLHEVLEILEGVKVFSRVSDDYFKLRNIFSKEVPLKFSIIESDENLIIEDKTYPKVLGSSFQVMVYEDDFYLPPYKQRTDYRYLRKKIDKSIEIDKKHKLKVLENIAPFLTRITSKVEIQEDIRRDIIEENLKVDFYLDRDKYITVEVLFRYGEYIINPIDPKEYNKFIKRDSLKEKEVLEVLSSMDLRAKDRSFYLQGDEEKEFNFLKFGTNTLLTYGDVYYSDNIKNKGIIKEFNIKADIKEKINYFEFNYSVGNLSRKEIKRILDAIRKGKKFYKMAKGEFIDLENQELNKLLRLLDGIGMGGGIDELIEIPKNKALIIDVLVKDNRVEFIEGLNFIEDMKGKITALKDYKVEIPEGLNATLREYQKVGYRWMKSLEYLSFGGVLGDEMGLGKTLQAITFILSNKNTKTLIVAPTSLIYNWRDEFNKFAPQLKLEILSGLPEERENKLNNIEDVDVIITSYGTLRRDIQLYKEKKFNYFIIDEAQNIKNASSLSAKCVKEIKADLRFALTGTPMENSLVELWSIFDFLMPGYLYSEEKFKELFDKDEESIKKLSMYIKPFILRRKKKDVILELPDKIEKNIIVDMKDEQKKVYKAYVDDIREKMEEEIDRSGISVKLLSYLTRIRQISLDPSLIMADYDGGSGKLEALLEIVQQSIEEGHKILVFSQFTSMLKIISKELKENKIKHYYLDGAMKAKDRIDTVTKFNEDDTPVFLISLKAGGTGLNLTGADLVIHFDPWWNPAVEDQATDRAHRFGQKNIVEVIKLIAKDSVEEKIVRLQENKKELINKVLENGLDSGQILKSLTEKELLELFT